VRGPAEGKLYIQFKAQVSDQPDSALAGQRAASGGHVATVLLIEDDSELAALMSAYLSRHGFRVDVARDGRQGLSQAVISSVDLVILDVMLPHLSGFDVLRYVRRRSRVPVIIVTARGAHDDRVAGLRLGADDYLSKPFEPEELLARLEAILRRTRGNPGRRHEVLQAFGISLDVTTRDVRRHGKYIDLTAAETDILEILMRSEGRAVSRDEMSAVLHQREATRYERSLDVHISRLRHKLGASHESLIRAVRGVGYMFSAQ
jgi:two-component system response regulator CpxR